LLLQINPTTAFAMLDTLNAPKGEWVLQVCPSLCIWTACQECAVALSLSAVDEVHQQVVCAARVQTAAGSLVGRSTIAIAKQKGIKTINVVRRSEQKQELLDLG
jgi:hypothetical protein